MWIARGTAGAHRAVLRPSPAPIVAHGLWTGETPEKSARRPAGVSPGPPAPAQVSHRPQPDDGQAAGTSTDVTSIRPARGPGRQLGAVHTNNERPSRPPGAQA